MKSLTTQFKALILAIVVGLLFIAVALNEGRLYTQVRTLRSDVNTLSMRHVVVAPTLTPIATPSAAVKYVPVLKSSTSGVIKK